MSVVHIEALILRELYKFTTHEDEEKYLKQHLIKFINATTREQWEDRKPKDD